MSMRLYSKQIHPLTNDIIRVLIEENECLEIAPREPSEDEEESKHSRIMRERYPEDDPSLMMSEFRQTISDVLRTYIKIDQELTQIARADVERRKDDPSMIYSEKRRLAKQRNFGLNDDAPSWIVGQLIEQFMFHTNSVADVFSEDSEIYGLLIPLIRERMSTQQNLQQEVTQRIKNLEKGSETWEDLFFQVNQRLKEKYQLD